jgi:hypothetical protein
LWLLFGLPFGTAALRGGFMAVRFSVVLCEFDGRPCDRRLLCHADSPRAGDFGVCPRFVDLSCCCLCNVKLDDGNRSNEAKNVCSVCMGRLMI